ncbi:G5 domain-containing protein, partial [Staphylococcus hominis]
PIVDKEEIPYETKRKFNPDLAPGTEEVVQKGENGEKTITTPTTKNPLTGEKVGEGEPTEEITKEPIDEIIEYGPDADADADADADSDADADADADADSDA